MHTLGMQRVSPTCGRTSDAQELRQSHSGLLSALLRVPLPSVHAAEISSLPQHIDKPEFPETGWDRLKDVFYRGEGQMYSEELRSIVKSGFAAAFVGMIYGGLPGARQAREGYIQVSQADIYQNRLDAVRSAHNAAIRGFVRFGWRWSWRVAAFVTLFNTVSTGLMVYRDKNALSHYAGAGAITGGIFRMNLGLRGLVSGTIIGAGLGLPAGLFIIGLQKLGGESLCDKRRRERRELHELRLAEWAARLNLTDDLIGEMSGQDRQTESDLKRIEELLSQPKNEKAVKDSDNR